MSATNQLYWTNLYRVTLEIAFYKPSEVSNKVPCKGLKTYCQGREVVHTEIYRYGLV